MRYVYKAWMSALLYMYYTTNLMNRSAFGPGTIQDSRTTVTESVFTRMQAGLRALRQSVQEPKETAQPHCKMLFNVLSIICVLMLWCFHPRLLSSFQFHTLITTWHHSQKEQEAEINRTIFV